MAAAGALLLVLVLVLLVTLNSGSTYTLHMRFQDAGGLVTGNEVLIGPARVGTVSSIALSPNGGADVALALNAGVGPMRQGTVARIYENSLSGLANKYVVLEPASEAAPPIPSGGSIPPSNAYSPVGLDQLFDALDAPTRRGLEGFIRGQAASINGHAQQANQTLQYFAPALASTSQATADLARDEPAFDGLLVQGAATMGLLVSRTQQLGNLIADTATTTGALASRSAQLEQTLALAPAALNHSTRTFAGLRATLNGLDPFVAASKPASRRLRPFSIALLRFTNASIPTISELAALIHNPTGEGDLTTLLAQTPSLAKVGARAFPDMIRQMNDSQHQVVYFREYWPDVVAALTDIGQAAANYDANGHYSRTQPVFSAFGVNQANQLIPIRQSDRYAGLAVVRNRCPGGAVQPPADGSAPWAIPGCSLTTTPPGP